MPIDKSIVSPRRFVLFLVVSFLASCATPVSRHDSKVARIENLERSIEWHTLHGAAPAPEFRDPDLIWTLPFDQLRLPPRLFFVPIYCSFDTHWYVPIVGETGELEGVIHARGVTRVLRPFAVVPNDSRLVTTHADRWVIGGIRDHPSLPWEYDHIYVFALEDTDDNRLAVGRADSLEEIFRMANAVWEITIKKG